MFRPQKLSFQAASPRQLYFEHQLLQRGIAFTRHASTQDVIFSAWVHYVVAEGAVQEAERLYEEVMATPEDQLADAVPSISEEELARLALAEDEHGTETAAYPDAAEAIRKPAYALDAQARQGMRWLYAVLGFVAAYALVRLVYSLVMNS